MSHPQKVCQKILSDKPIVSVTVIGFVDDARALQSPVLGEI